jgi:hypothetical protein
MHALEIMGHRPQTPGLRAAQQQGQIGRLHPPGGRCPPTYDGHLASLLARSSPGLRFNEHMDEADSSLIFQHACKMGLEGIVSKRKDSAYRSGRSPDWSKNPNAPVVEREAEGGLGSIRSARTPAFGRGSSGRAYTLSPVIRGERNLNQHHKGPP